jgi:uncharacterized membrane protein (UPF0182 family)
MYFLLLALLLIGGGTAARRGIATDRRWLAWAGIVVVATTIGLFAILELWGEALWFDAVGYAGRFWTFLGAAATLALAGACLALVGVALLALPLRGHPARLYPLAVAAGAVGGAVWGLDAWQTVLLFLQRAEAGVSEPLFGLDAGFYLFTLPFLGELHGLLTWVVVVTVAAAAAGVLLDAQQQAAETDGGRRTANGAGRPPAVASAAAGVALAFGALLAVPRLLYSDTGVVAGPGWTDAHVRLPAYLVLALLTALLAALPLLPALRRWSAAHLGDLVPQAPSAVPAVGVTWTTIGALWFVIAGLLPAGFQWLVVEPNEITYERPYIENNIALTREGFGLGRVEQRQYPADEDFTRQTVEQNRHLVSEIRLWDWRALDAVYQQFQEIRLYYEFTDVDVDRYRIDGRYRQVMVSAREMSQDNLPAQSQTFVNRRFKYTHGYGLTLATVSDFTPEGLPNLLVKDIPPVAEHPSLEVTRPEIYYGELTFDPVVVNSEEREFDHPSGENNVYVRYQGDGGVEMRNLWRKFVFGWKFDGTRFLFSTYPNADSRVMFHRQVQDRVATLAPFLTLDEDPYLVLADGRLYWIVDAYTTSPHFPYSQPFSAHAAGEWRARRTGDSASAAYLDGVNYVRNSVKVVVDAYQGSVDFYVFAPDDPLIATWRKVLPGMFRDRAQMPAALQRHVRYPQGLLLTQGLVYAKYHMRDPEVFYNKEDLWVRATEKHYGGVQPVEPYYVMWELPESDEAEFVLMLPFTPKDRQVLIGWIAGLSDGENYGRFLAYQFPKERRVLGPQQVESKIDQDSYLSAQLSLWDQRGSSVIRGNVLAIPLDDTLLYVEPIYLEAETAAYPELRMVVTMHGDNMSYAETLDEALAGLFSDRPPAAQRTAGDRRTLGRRANAAFTRYLDAQGDARFDDAAQALGDLQRLLEDLADSAPPAARAAKTHDPSGSGRQ